MITDKEIKWLRKMIFLPIQASQSFNALGVTPAAGGAASQVLQAQGLESATSIIKQISTLLSTGGNVTTANDGFDWQIPIPYDIDVTKNIGVSVVWTKDNAGGSHLTQVTWKVLYGAVNFAAPVVGTGGVGGALVSPTTALDTTIAAHPVTGSDNLLAYTSPRGIISPAVVPAGAPSSAAGKGLITPSLGWWGLRAQLVTYSGSIGDNLFILGLLIDYAVRKAQGGVRPVDVGILKNPLDTAPVPAIVPG